MALTFQSAFMSRPYNNTYCRTHCMKSCKICTYVCCLLNKWKHWRFGVSQSLKEYSTENLFLSIKTCTVSYRFLHFFFWWMFFFFLTETNDSDLFEFGMKMKFCCFTIFRDLKVHTHTWTSMSVWFWRFVMSLKPFVWTWVLSLGELHLSHVISCITKYIDDASTKRLWSLLYYDFTIYIYIKDVLYLDWNRGHKR